MKQDAATLPEIDAIDRRILAELQADGRMTNVELARRAGISAPPCLRRVRRLEEAGIIRGYHADTDPQLLGWEVTFFVIVGLEPCMLRNVSRDHEGRGVPHGRDTVRAKAVLGGNGGPDRFARTPHRACRRRCDRLCSWCAGVDQRPRFVAIDQRGQLGRLSS